MLYEMQRRLSGKTTPSTASTFMQHNALGQHADSATIMTSQCAYILKYVSPNIRMVIKSQICIGE